MEKVTLLPPYVVRETRAEVVLVQVDFNRQFFDRFHEVFERDEGWPVRSLMRAGRRE
jgi:hypothetical protein